ncbi:MAG: hypothetical protein WCF08_10770 [Anaerolineaceae bacterium]
MIITTRINNDITLDQTIRNRYQWVITELQKNGFTYLLSYSETQFPFSLLLLTPIYFMMRNHSEIVRITSPLRVTAYYPLLVHHETGTIALINGLNTKFYSQFIDGTLIISVNSETKTLNDVETRLFKTSFPGSEVTAWEKHLEWMNTFLKDGKHTNLSARFEEYCAMSIREEKTSILDTLILIGIWVFILLGFGRIIYSVLTKIFNLFF